MVYLLFEWIVTTNLYYYLDSYELLHWFDYFLRIEHNYQLMDPLKKIKIKIKICKYYINILEDEMRQYIFL
jgi:hypothetical protein